MLNLPSSTEFGRRVPKQKFYEHLDVSPEVKRLFIDQIRADHMGEQAFAADDEPAGADGHGNRGVSHPPDWAGA